MSSVDVRSIDALAAFRAELGRFRGAARDAIQQTDLIVGHELEWLARRCRYWERVVAECEEEYRRARAALEDCLRSDDDDCSGLAARVRRAEAALRAALKELQTVRHHLDAVRRAAEDYRRQAYRLAQALERDLPAASASLAAMTNALQSYTAVGAASGSGIGAPSGGTPSGAGGAAGQGGAYAAAREGQIAAAASALYDLGISRAAWDGSTPEARLATLQRIEDALARVQRRPAVNVTAKEMPSANYGGYNGECIAINSAQLAGKLDVNEHIDTIVHEGRHAFQYFAVANPDVVDDPDVVAAWAANMPPNYWRPEDDLRRYRSQPLEADAWDYAERVMAELRRLREGR